MIQRIQSLWMLLAAITVFLTLQLPIFGGTLLADKSYHQLMGTDNLLILILTSSLGTGILINIFLYKNRKLQSRILLLGALMEGLILYLYVRETSKYANGNYLLWSSLHLLFFIWLILAARGIYKDTKLIRESNRLR
jgi:hypothetical protein